MVTSRLVAAIAVAACIASPVYAQAFVKQLSRVGMTQADIDIMVAAGAELYNDGTASAGADTIWLNPETDAHGLAEITEVDGSCIRIAYRFRTNKQADLQSVEVRRCLTDGAWVLSD